MRWVVILLLGLGGCGGAQTTGPEKPSARDLAIVAAKSPGPHWLRRPRVRMEVTGRMQQDCERGVGEACFALALQEPLPPGRADAAWDARVKLHVKACEAGVPLGCYFGGDLISRGLARNSGTPTAGLEMVTRACEAGVLRACTRIGEMVTKGVYPPAQPSAGEAIYRAVCAAGDAAACSASALAHGRALVRDAAKRGDGLEGPETLFLFSDPGCRQADDEQQDGRRCSAALTDNRRHVAVNTLNNLPGVRGVEKPTRWLRDLCLDGDHLSCVHFTTTCGRFNLESCGFTQRDLERGAQGSVKIAGATLALPGGCRAHPDQTITCHPSTNLKWFEAETFEAAQKAGLAELKKVRRWLELSDKPVTGEATGRCRVLDRPGPCHQLTTAQPGTVYWGGTTLNNKGVFFICSEPDETTPGGRSAPCNLIFRP